jgi:hypothetical protein
MSDYDDLIARLVRFDGRKCISSNEEIEAADAIETLRRERDEVLAAQGYLYIGRDGKPILARDLEDQRDAALALLREAGEVLERGINCIEAEGWDADDERALLAKIKIEIDNVDGQKKD